MVLGQGVLSATDPSRFPQETKHIRLWDSGTRWSLLQPTSTSFNWTSLDKILATAESRGCDVLYCFGSTPAWCSTKPTESGVYGPGTAAPPDLSAWKNFITAVVNHVKRPDGTFRIRKWEVWNEVNNTPFFSGTNAQMFQMAQIAYSVIKSIDPGAIVTTPTPCWCRNTTYQWLDQWFALGGAPLADVVTFHGYVNTTVPDPPEKIAFTIDQIRAVMAKYGVKKPLWDTESGWDLNTNIPDPQAQVAWMAGWIKIRREKAIDASYWYQWDNLGRGTCYINGALTAPGKAWIQFMRGLPAVQNLRLQP